MTQRELYEQLKANMREAIEAIRAQNPALAAHLTEHIHMDDEKMTFRYDGDVEWQL